MHVACVLIDHFPFKLEAVRDPLLKRRRAIVFKRSGSQRTVVDASPGIKRVVAGMPLQEAQSICKDAVLIEADIPRYERDFSHVLLRLATWSPVVEAAGLGRVYVGLDGLERTYGGEAQLIDGLLQAVPGHLEPRLGVSQGKFPAYLAAISAQPGRACRTPTGLKDFLAPFSVDVLPVPWEVRTRLHSFGLHTLAQIASLPLGPVQAQFGSTGARMWRLSRGMDDRPLLPTRPEEEVKESISFPVPTANLEPLLLAIENLLSRLFARPEMRGRFARTALLEGHMPNGPSRRRRFVFKTPVGDRPRAYSVIKALLDSFTLPGPLEEVSLTLKDMAGEVGRQESLFHEVRRREQLREAIAQLKVSQRRNPVYQVREVEPWSRIPERRRALMPYEP